MSLIDCCCVDAEDDVPDSDVVNDVNDDTDVFANDVYACNDTALPLPLDNVTALLLCM